MPGESKSVENNSYMNGLRITRVQGALSLIHPISYDGERCYIIIDYVHLWFVYNIRLNCLIITKFSTEHVSITAVFIITKWMATWQNVVNKQGIVIFETNTLRLYMCHWTGSTLFQLMACRLFVAITWTNNDLLSIKLLRTTFSDIFFYRN